MYNPTQNLATQLQHDRYRTLLSKNVFGRQSI